MTSQNEELLAENALLKNTLKEITKSSDDDKLPTAEGGGAPSWANVPSGLIFPKERQVLFIRFRAEWTDTPSKGERQCIVWPCSMGDKKIALDAASGDPNAFMDSIVRQMVRSIDGQLIDWSGAPGTVNLGLWMDEIGEKCRSMLNRIYMQLHVISAADSKDFFESCVAVRTANG